MAEREAAPNAVGTRTQRRPDPRMVLLAAVVVTAVCIAELVRLRGFDGAFRLWNIPGYGTPFLDWRLIPGSARSYSQGLDPAIANPGDPIHRLFNYPKIWYLFFQVPMPPESDIPAGIAIFGGFWLSVVFFRRRTTRLSELLIFIGLISPAAMLGASRANVDLLVFIVMVLALALVNRHAVGALLVFLVGVLFKIFPILGVGFFLDRNRNAGLKYIAAAAALSLLYFGVTFRDMLSIFRITQRGYEEAYGAAVLPALLNRLATAPDLREHSVGYVQALQAAHDLLLQFPIAPYLLAAVTVLTCAYMGLRHGAPLIEADVRSLRAFWMGAGVYAGTFLLGNNFDYRLIFLLLCIPQLAEWASGKQRVTTAAARLTLGLIFAAQWAMILQRPVSGTVSLAANSAGLLDQIANWVLLAAIAFLFGSSLPAWAVNDTTTWLQWLIRRPHTVASALGAEAGRAKRD